MRKKVWYLIAGVMTMAALVAVVSSFSVNSGAAQSSASPAACASPVASPAAASMASPAASPEACASPAAGGTAVTIDLEDIKFVPNAVTIPANTPVKFTLSNKGALPHDFSIDKLHINVSVDPGQTGETTINAPAGTYQFYCNVPGHKEAGMVGTLTVK